MNDSLGEIDDVIKLKNQKKHLKVMSFLSPIIILVMLPVSIVLATLTINCFGEWFYLDIAPSLAQVMMDLTWPVTGGTFLLIRLFHVGGKQYESLIKYKDDLGVAGNVVQSCSVIIFYYLSPLLVLGIGWLLYLFM